MTEGYHHLGRPVNTDPFSAHGLFMGLDGMVLHVDFMCCQAATRACTSDEAAPNWSNGTGYHVDRLLSSSAPFLLNLSGDARSRMGRMPCAALRQLASRVPSTVVTSMHASRPALATVPACRLVSRWRQHELGLGDDYIHMPRRLSAHYKRVTRLHLR
jgi:hypothetical protein